MLVTDGMGLIGKLPLVFSLHKQTAVRIRHAPVTVRSFSSSAGQLLL